MVSHRKVTADWTQRLRIIIEHCNLWVTECINLRLWRVDNFSVKESEPHEAVVVILDPLGR